MALTPGIATVTASSSSSISVSATAVTGGSGTYAYQWMRSSDGGSTYSNLSGATSLTATDSTVVQGAGYYYVLSQTDTVPDPDQTVVTNADYAMAVNPTTVNPDAVGATGIPAQVTVVPSQADMPTSLITFQKVIAATGTAVQFPSNVLTNGGLITAAPNNNTAGVLWGNSNVTNTLDGGSVGNGDLIQPGASKPVSIDNTSRIWVNGTIGDIITFEGS